LYQRQNQEFSIKPRQNHKNFPFPKPKTKNFVQISATFPAPGTKKRKKKVWWSMKQKAETQLQELKQKLF
jgi:hypothetical protein